MRRTLEGWLILLISAPILLWGLTKGAVYLVSLAAQVEIRFGKPFPSLLELFFYWVFTAPIATGAYHWMTQSERRKRRFAAAAMILPLACLFAMNVNSAFGEWWLFSSLTLSLIAYIILTLFLAHKISEWQS